jgi:hypothetical protein
MRLCWSLADLAGILRRPIKKCPANRDAREERARLHIGVAKNKQREALHERWQLARKHRRWRRGCKARIRIGVGKRDLVSVGHVAVHTKSARWRERR